MADEHQHNNFLERLFQQKAGEFDIPYREEDWNKLERKLEISDLRRNYRKKIALLTAASILIISLLGYFTYSNTSKINEIARQIESTEESARDLETLRADDLIVADDIERETVEDAVIGLNEVEIELAVIEPNDIVKSDPADESHAQRDLFIPGEHEIERRQADAAGFTQRHPGALVPYPAEGIAKISDEDRSPYRAGIHPTEIEEKDGWLTLRDLPEDTGTRSLDRSGFSVGILISPDLSAAGSPSGFHDPGYKFGITTEYSLSPNLSLSGGFVFSDVRYTAQSGQYNPPDYWNQGNMPIETEAICRILDIPITLKYNFLNFDASRFFATAGISSYIMLNEDYRFSYDQYDGQSIQQLNIRNGSRHLLNNAGFSIGYEIDLHQNWSLRAEPFIKIPLGEVGWGNVELYSVGSFISVYLKL